MSPVKGASSASALTDVLRISLRDTVAVAFPYHETAPKSQEPLPVPSPMPFLHTFLPVQSPITTPQYAMSDRALVRKSHSHMDS